MSFSGTRVRTNLGPRGRVRDLGHLVPILRDGMLETYLRAALEQQDDFEIWAGTERHIVVVRPESVKQVLGGSEDFERNIRPTKNLFGAGLLRLDGAEWKPRRQLFVPPFRREAFETLVPMLQEETERLITLWRPRTEAFKPTRDLSFLMLRILGRLLFGFEFDQVRHGGRPLHSALITLSTDSVLRHFVPSPLVWAFNHRKVVASRKFLDNVCREILDLGTPTPFMIALRGAVADGTLNRQTAIDEIRTFLIAGHETTATALAWTVATIASQPHILGDVLEEIEVARNASTPEEVAKLEHTTRLVKEVIRLYPPVPISISQANKDTTLGRLKLKRGTRVDICSYVLHRLPWLWPDPDRVDPSRFAVTPASGTWIPFLIGPHSCLGTRLALIELPLIASRLLGAFEFTLPEGPPTANLRLSLNPAGLKITVKPKNTAAS